MEFALVVGGIVIALTALVFFIARVPAFNDKIGKLETRLLVKDDAAAKAEKFRLATKKRAALIYAVFFQILGVIIALVGLFLNITSLQKNFTTSSETMSAELTTLKQRFADAVQPWERHNIIDIHGHIGSYAGYDLDTKTLLSNIDRYGVKLILVSNIDGANLPETKNVDEVAANAETSRIVRMYPDKLRGLVWTRPNDGKPENLEPFLRETLSPGNSRVFVGMKFHPIMNQFPADDQKVDGYLKLCEKYRIPAVFHSDKPGTNADPQKIYAVARRHPNVPIVLYHSVFFGPHSAAVEVVKEALKKKDADLYLETAQFKTDEALAAVQTIGSDRILFGTDATYFGKDHYQKYENMVSTFKNKLSPEDFVNVIHGNAVKLFRLR